MKNGYFLCADILGFSEIVKNLSGLKDQKILDQTIDKWINIVRDLTKKYEIDNQYQLLSDTLFLGIEDDDKKLSSLLYFCQELLEVTIENSLPVRGAICYGNYSFEKEMGYGKAIIEAHELEQKQNWIGITLDNRITYFVPNLTICYPIPMKAQEKIMLYKALSWKVPKFEKLAELMNKDGLGGTQDKTKQLDWGWGEKIGNTVMFGIYLDALRQKGSDGSKFYGFHPVHFIDLTLRK
jgi:hypothetical protein